MEHAQEVGIALSGYDNINFAQSFLVAKLA